jgi:hypothetical protein
VTPAASYTAATTISFSCSGPSGSHCSVSPASLNWTVADGVTVKTAKLTVYTTGGNGVTAQVRPGQLGGKAIWLALLPLPLFGMLLRGKRRNLALVVLLLMLCLLLGAISCGGSKSSGSSGLAAGSYSITLTATANTTPAQTLTKTYSLQVNHQ